MIGTAAIATYCAWILSLLLIMGGGQIVENIRLLRESSSGALIIFSPERMRAGVGTLLGPSTFGLVVPALAAGGVAFWRARGERRFALLLLLTFQMLWFMWFAFASIAWPRYAFPALALNAILMGFLFDSALTWCSARYGARLSPQVIRVAATGALTLALVATGVRQLAPLRDGSDAPQRFATRIEPLIPASSSVDGWEPEIDFLIDRPLRYPPLGSLDQVVRARWLDSGDDIEFSDDLTGEFLVVGPFGRWTGVYAPAVESANYELVERVGEYELYRRIAN
jgi:hypothetical protein